MQDIQDIKKNKKTKSEGRVEIGEPKEPKKEVEVGETVVVTGVEVKTDIQKIELNLEENGLAKQSFYQKYLKDFLDELKEYLIGTLMMPWIWIFGYLFIASVLFWLAEPAHLINIEQNLPPDLNIKIDDLWRGEVLLIFINYTIAFFLQKVYPKLNYLIFAISFLTLCVFIFIVWSALLEIGF